MPDPVPEQTALRTAALDGVADPVGGSDPFGGFGPPGGPVWWHPRRARVPVLAFGGVLAAILTVVGGLAAVDATTGPTHHVESRTFPASITRVVVHTSNGDVRLHGPDAELFSTAELAGDDAQAGIRLVARLSGVVEVPELDTRVVGDTLRITAHCHTDWDCSADYDLDLPAGVNVAADSSSGDVTADGLGGTVRLWTSSGDVTVDRPRGALDAGTGSGNIQIDAARTGRLQAETGSGDIQLDLTAPPDDLDVRTGSGDVQVTLPTTADAYDVQVSTGSGGRTIAIRTDPAAARRLRVTTGSGDVSVTYPDAS